MHTHSFVFQISSDRQGSVNLSASVQHWNDGTHLWTDTREMNTEPALAHVNPNSVPAMLNDALLHLLAVYGREMRCSHKNKTICQLMGDSRWQADVGSLTKTSF